MLICGQWKQAVPIAVLCLSAICVYQAMRPTRVRAHTHFYAHTSEIRLSTHVCYRQIDGHVVEEQQRQNISLWPLPTFGMGLESTPK